MPDLYSEELSAYLDGELDALRRRRLEVHLAECPECTATLADLRAIVAAAPYYQGRQPSRDLWQELEARLDEPRELPPRQASAVGHSPERPARRFGWTQLIAASLAMAVLGGGATWLALRNAAPGSTDVAVQPALLPSYPLAAPPADSAKTVAYAEEQYDAAVRDLELLLEAGRNRLDSTTVKTIELSLSKIDAAIAEARAAVQRDPSNAYLSRQIAANMRRKLNLLRVATNAIAARTS